MPVYNDIVCIGVIQNILLYFQKLPLRGTTKNK